VGLQHAGKDGIALREEAASNVNIHATTLAPAIVELPISLPTQRPQHLHEAPSRGTCFEFREPDKEDRENGDTGM
jgi:hypothetical protein